MSRLRIFLLPLAGEGGPAKRGRMRALGAILDDVGDPAFSGNSLIRPRFAGSPSPASGRRKGRVLAILLAALLAAPPAAAAPHEHAKAAAKKEPPTPPLPPTPPPATPAPPPDTRPYDPQLMRLAEILGVLTYMRGLCGAGDADQYRARMQALLDAEGSPATRKDRLAGAYNRGIQGYSLSYRTCTPSARLVIERFLKEGGDIAKAVENRYRAS